VDLAVQPAHHARSLGELFGDMTRDFSTLIRKEVELAKTELKEEAQAAGKAGGMLGAAGVVGLVAFIILAMTIAFALDAFLWRWVAFLIVTVVLAVSISFDADVDRACELLERIARSEPRVMREPAPAARVKALGDLGVNLELTAWMADLAAGEADLRSTLLRLVLKDFKAEGIAIAYRRREAASIPTLATENSDE
jgi:MFS family permease